MKLSKCLLISSLALLTGLTAMNVSASAASKKSSNTETTAKVEDKKPTPAATVVKSADVDKSLPYYLSGGYAYTSPELTDTLGTYKNFARTTWYSMGTYTIDRSAQGHGRGIYVKLQSGDKSKTIWAWRGYVKPITDSAFNVAAKNSDYFKNMDIAVLGDSITYGYDGTANLLDANYPTWLSKYLNTKTYNFAHNGANLATENKGDFTEVLHHHNFKNYDAAVIAYGTNDYAHSTYDLSAITDVLKDNIEKMKSENPNLIIYGILPIDRYDKDLSANEIAGKGGYTFNELRDALAKTYEEEGVSYLDWRNDAKQLITDKNYAYRLNDAHLHPTARTYQMMGKEIANFMINTFPEDRKPKVEQPKKDTAKDKKADTTKKSDKSKKKTTSKKSTTKTTNKKATNSKK